MHVDDGVVQMINEGNKDVCYEDVRNGGDVEMCEIGELWRNEMLYEIVGTLELCNQ
jgi:hypothetical protein